MVAARPRFTAALKTVQQAVDAGVTSATDADEVVRSGDTKMMTVLRQLPAAVRELDELGNLRDQLTRLCDVGPYEWPAAAYVGDVASLLDLEGAGNFEDTTRTRVLQDPFPRTLREVGPRTGGKWLALLTGGYHVQINTR